MIERYLDGHWVGYMLAFVAGMAFWRFVMTPTDAHSDAIGLIAAAAVCIFILWLRRLNQLKP